MGTSPNHASTGGDTKSPKQSNNATPPRQSKSDTLSIPLLADSSPKDIVVAAIIVVVVVVFVVVHSLTTT
ncbi:bZIP transcription factor [Colletotrichum lupini]|uniref:BZIP transcription factor n=1 Tax=Colletotrichum lupini TaxID=145971 RepID=A0A9Q8WJR8_9PEZI|nr:bZIP transcription factor [Colletotrichum lupini]UQC85160.1 bZIP transcription factor [Colletotrichum lupini]